MLFKINSIQFDFTDDTADFEPSVEYQESIIDEVKDHKWVAEDDDDLIEEITNCAGWCIKSIDYDVV